MLVTDENVQMNRLVRVVRKHGLIGAVTHAIVVARRKLFQNQNYVFRHSGSESEVKPKTSIEIERYDEWSKVPLSSRQQILDELGDQYENECIRELDERGVLWLGLEHDRVAAIQWSKQGEHIRNWFVSLNVNDIVIFATTTFQAYRGKRIAPYMMRSIIEVEVRDNCDAYVDCKVWNKSAESGILRAGFKRIAQLPPL